MLGLTPMVYQRSPVASRLSISTRVTAPVQPPADEIDATTAPLPTEQPERSAEPVAAVDQSAVSTDIADQPTTMPQADDAPAAEDVPQPDELPEISDLSDIVADTPLAVTPEPLPRITPITPAEASASVTILAPLVSDQPTLLPPIAEIDRNDLGVEVTSRPRLAGEALRSAGVLIAVITRHCMDPGELLGALA